MSSHAVIAAIAIGILVAEIYAWLPRIAEWLVTLAASRLPEPACQRYLADWLGELDVRPGGVAKVVFAAQIFVTKGLLLGELPPTSQEHEEPAPRSEPSSPIIVLPKTALPRSVSALTVAPRIRTLNAGDASLLDSFTTGTAAWERDIAYATQELCQMLGEDQLDSYEGRVAETSAGQPVVGFSAYRRRPFGDVGEFTDAVCVALLGLNRPYRGIRMPDHMTRVDSLLLADALAQIDRKWGRPRMPHIWTLAHRDHEDELTLLGKHRFWRLKASNPSGAYHVYLRPAGLPWEHGFSPRIVKTVGTFAD